MPEGKLPEGNFVLARAKDESRALWIRDALAGCGIAVRAFPGRQRLESSLRVTCPGDEKKFTRLAGALELVRQPQAICFDLDGVLADVSQSYRRAIVECARSFGVDVSATDIGELKARGNANNDWVVTQRLLARAGVEVPLEFVTRQFESLYQGEDGRAGLCASERLLVEPERWRAWAGRLPLAVVTGRPRRDAERFLAEHELAGSVAALICMEDAEPKPSPRPIELARARLGVSRVWMLGDTRDDIESARAAGALPIGVVAPGEDFERSSETLFAAGAARVLAMTTELEDLWPW